MGAKRERRAGRVGPSLFHTHLGCRWRAVAGHGRGLKGGGFPEAEEADGDEADADQHLGVEGELREEVVGGEAALEEEGHHAHQDGADAVACGGGGRLFRTDGPRSVD